MPPKKGHVISDETKQKIRISLLGRKHTLKRRRNISKGKRGKKWSVAQREGHVDCHSGRDHWHWKGGRSVDKTNGYIVVYQKGKHTTREHRVVAEKMLGRKLRKGEIVHHINGIGADNRPENLRIFKNLTEHLKLHRREKCRASLAK